MSSLPLMLLSRSSGTHSDTDCQTSRESLNYGRMKCMYSLFYHKSSKEPRTADTIWREGRFCSRLGSRSNTSFPKRMENRPPHNLCSESENPHSPDTLSHTARNGLYPHCNTFRSCMQKHKSQAEDKEVQGCHLWARSRKDKAMGPCLNTCYTDINSLPARKGPR